MIRCEWQFCEIEVGTAESRSGSYFFVTQTGRAYATRADGPDEYVELGNVFDEGILGNWLAVSDARANRERMRERIQLITGGRPRNYRRGAPSVNSLPEMSEVMSD